MARMALTRAKVYDPVLRSIHAWNGFAVLLLLLSAQIASLIELTPEASMLWRFHAWIGYALVVGLVARLSWGLNGPQHARIFAMWHGRAWWHALRTRQWFTPPGGLGHHPLASAAYLLFYLALLVVAVSGLALAAIEQGSGPLVFLLEHDVLMRAWFSIPHDILEEFVAAFVVFHVAALILHEARHGVPLAQAMISGYQYRKDAE
jgi:Ni/Fe-hydrogenase 1 B-type cytochrome subunit